jgi:N-acetylglucosaminyl-diphospho-decaprenol L-rhamnosyltransferase
MSVTVAVVSWNTRELLAGALQSLESAAAAGLAEVWVLDNASTDGSAALVARRFPWVHLIASEHNLGFGAAINAVAAQSATDGAQAEWIAAANADIVLHPGALETLLSAGRHHPRVGIVAPALVLPDGSTEHSLHPFPGLGPSLALNLGAGRLSPRLARRLALDGRWDQSVARRGDWAHGAFLLIRRRAFDQINGFDPGQFLYAEDLDIAWRLSRDGWQTRYEPAAKVDHVGGAAIRQFYGDDRDRQAQRSAYAWMLRRRGAPLMRTCALINAVGAGVRAAAAPWRWPAASPGLSAWQLRRHTRMHLSGLIASRRSLEQHR